MKNPEFRKGYDAVKAELNLLSVLQCRHSLKGAFMSTADSFIRVRLDKELKNPKQVRFFRLWVFPYPTWYG